MLRYDLPAGSYQQTDNAKRQAGRRKTKLVVMLAIILPMLSMLAGAALAAYHYGVL